MNIAILVFLILNFGLLALLVGCAVALCLDENKKTKKRIADADEKINDLQNLHIEKCNELREYKKRYPIKTKYKIGDKVFVILGDNTAQGKICKVHIEEDSAATELLVYYSIDCMDRKVKAIEENVYLQKH